MNLKERAAFKYCDAKQERDVNNQIKKMASEINKLSSQQDFVKSLLGPIEYEKVTLNKTHIKDELTEYFTTLNIKFKIEEEEGFDSPGYAEDFMAIAFFDENDELQLLTILFEFY